MKNAIKGFTLIELLVVVLIIGILAAIALPQYRKVVLKSRYATLKNTVKAIEDAEMRYYLVNDAFTTEIDELDVEVDMNRCSIETDFDIKCVLIYSGGALEYKKKISGDTYRTRCCASPNDTTTNIYNEICQQETGKEMYDGQTPESNCYVY